MPVVAGEPARSRPCDGEPCHGNMPDGRAVNPEMRRLYHAGIAELELSDPDWQERLYQLLTRALNTESK